MPYLKRPTKVKRPLSDRKKEANEIYNTHKWRQLRKSKLMNSPICEICGKELASQIHHKDSFMKYEGLKRKEVAYDFDNLQSLCELCHIKIHQEQRKHKK